MRVELRIVGLGAALAAFAEIPDPRGFGDAVATDVSCGTAGHPRCPTLNCNSGLRCDGTRCG